MDLLKCEDVYVEELIIPSSQKWALAKRVDPEQTPQNTASDQGLH